jgi:small-conductance mechanosensitive channel
VKGDVKMNKFLMDEDGHLTRNPDYTENTEQEVLSLKNIIISLRKSNREYNELLDQQDKQIESLQQDVARKLNVNSRLREEKEHWKELFFLLKSDHEKLENFQTNEWMVKAREMGIDI